MITLIIRFIDIVMAGIVAGILFGIWLGYNPKTFTVLTYIEQQQSAIKSLNTIMPLLGLITIILTIISAFLEKDNKTIFISLILATTFLVISGLVTKFGNQPINKINDCTLFGTGFIPGFFQNSYYQSLKKSLPKISSIKLIAELT